MNIGDLKTKAISLVAQYSNGGVLISSNDNADYLLRGNMFIDQFQKEVATRAKIHKYWTFSQNTIDPVNGRGYGFDIVQFIPNSTGDLVDISGINGQSYYFEVDSQCTVYFEQSPDGINWTNIISPLNITGITTFTAYSGTLTPISTNTVRLRFTGTYPFNRRNAALWCVHFSTIPVYSRFIEYTVPDNLFLDFDKIVHRTDSQVYEQMLRFSSVRRKTFVLDYYYKGSFDIHYHKVPNTVYAGTTTTATVMTSGTALGGTINTIQLASTSSPVLQAYNGMTIELTGGTGNGQIGVITEYTAATQTATVQSNWTTIPDNTTQYQIKNYTADNYELEVYPGMPQETIAYGVAGHFILDEYPSLAATLLNEYQNKLSNLTNPEPFSLQTVYSPWGW